MTLVRRHLRARALGAASLVFAAAGPSCGSSVFVCDDTHPCGPGGQCEASGYCSFPDSSCSSGRRYGAHSGGGLASKCVDDQGGSGSSSSTSSSTTGVASTSPSTSGGGTSGATSTTLSVSDGTTSGSPSTSGGSTGDPGVLDVDGELIDVIPGWQGGVWIDFSDAFTFDAQAYPDQGVVYNNAPQSMFVLRDPFSPGLAAITVHTIIELLPPDQVTERDFFRAVSVFEGPDALWQAVDCRGWNGISASYCLSSGSQGGGDGIFAVDSSWSMSLVQSINNANYIGFDAQGLFENLGGPSLFFGTPVHAIRFPLEVVTSAAAEPRVVIEDGRLAAILDGSSSQSLALVHPVSHQLDILRTEQIPADPISQQNAGALTIATGDLTGLPGVLYVIVQASELHEYDADGTDTPLVATEAGQGWRWASVVIPEPGHPLAIEGKPTFYVLESNRMLDRDRVIWLQPP